MNTSVEKPKQRNLGFVPRVELKASAQQAFCELAAILESVASGLPDAERAAFVSLANWLEGVESVENFLTSAAAAYRKAYQDCGAERQSVKLRFEGTACILRMDTTFAAELIVDEEAQLAIWGSGNDLLTHVGASKGRWTKGKRSSAEPLPLRPLLLQGSAAVGQFDSFD